LIWSFRKSRDRWKSKHQALKCSLKREKNRVADLTKSRQQWRLKAQQASQLVSVLEAQLADLRSQLKTCTGEKKVSDPSPSRPDPLEQQAVRGLHYPLGVVKSFTSLVLDSCASFRCAAGALRLFGRLANWPERVPDWSTGRWWLLRIGLGALVRPKVKAEDWVWMLDHSIQIG
jgi:hypothetical protein